MTTPSNAEMIEQIRHKVEMKKLAGEVAYREAKLPYAMSKLAEMCEIGVNLGYDFDLWFGMFARCKSAEMFGKGDPVIVGGISGAKLAMYVEEFYLGYGYVHPRMMASESENHGREYYLFGVHYAYLQWYLNRSFAEINFFVPVRESFPLSQKAVSSGNEKGELFIFEMERLLASRAFFVPVK